MKEIKAYIRREKAEDGIHTLEEAGLPGMLLNGKAAGCLMDFYEEENP
ncbi:MAG: hypothetical protein HY883_05165 [Deltaproteobacteria bacterium]|nr:hypothetical protein [Deltaproteobacteria bacterium]